MSLKAVASPLTQVFLKKCKRLDDVLIVKAAEHFEKGKRQSFLTEEHIGRIVETYRERREEERFSRRVAMAEIEANGFNLNLSRYVSTAKVEQKIDLEATHAELMKIDQEIRESTARHNAFLVELGLPPLP